MLMGHTASDLAESAAMRQEGSTTPDARAWSPSAGLAGGAGRLPSAPLLGASRSDLRAWLKDQKAAWIDDPANEDIRFARSRARQGSPPGESPASRVRADIPRDLALSVQEDWGLVMPRRALRTAPLEAAMALTGLACVCAGGGERLPRSDRLARLVQALRDPDAVTMTLSGCQVLADEDLVRWIRPAGEVSRSGSPTCICRRGRLASGTGVSRSRALPASLSAPLPDICPACRQGRARISPGSIPARGAACHGSGMNHRRPGPRWRRWCSVAFRPPRGLSTGSPATLDGKDVPDAVDDRIGEFPAQQVGVPRPDHVRLISPAGGPGWG